MSIIDRALAAITSPESEKARTGATARARAAATPGDWLSLALDHHDRIRQAFEDCRTVRGASARLSATRRLAVVLTGHLLAEEIVLYPALAKAGDRAQASQAYAEQTTAKMQMAELEQMDPATDAWLIRLEQIRGAVLHHLYEEERSWFIDLKHRYDDQQTLTSRYREEFDRYTGGSRAAA